MKKMVIPKVETVLFWPDTGQSTFIAVQTEIL